LAALRRRIDEGTRGFDGALPTAAATAAALELETATAAATDVLALTAASTLAALATEIVGSGTAGRVSDAALGAAAAAADTDAVDPTDDVASVVALLPTSVRPPSAGNSFSVLSDFFIAFLAAANLSAADTDGVILTPLDSASAEPVSAELASTEQGTAGAAATGGAAEKLTSILRKEESSGPPVREEVAVGAAEAASTAADQVQTSCRGRQQRG